MVSTGIDSCFNIESAAKGVSQLVRRPRIVHQQGLLLLVSRFGSAPGSFSPGLDRPFRDGLLEFGLSYLLLKEATSARFVRIVREGWLHLPSSCGQPPCRELRFHYGDTIGELPLVQPPPWRIRFWTRVPPSLFCSYVNDLGARRILRLSGATRLSSLKAAPCCQDNQRRAHGRATHLCILK